MKTILLPTDFSNNSLNAISFAVKMLENIDCTFYLLNVQKASSFVSDDFMLAAPTVNVYQAIIQSANSSLDNIVSKIKSESVNPNHEFITIVDYDNFIDAINQVCITKNIDLIIMGTKGASGLSRVVFGSNTIHVMQRGKAPVLAIPDSAIFKGFNKVLFTSNYLSPYKNKDIGILLELTEIYDSVIDILHIASNNELSDIQKKNKANLDDCLKNVAHQFVDLNGSKVIEAVNDYVLKNEVNLLAMTNRKHSFLERLFTRHQVENFASNLSIPLLVMENHVED